MTFEKKMDLFRILLIDIALTTNKEYFEHIKADTIENE